MNPVTRFVTRTGVLLAIALVFQFVKLPAPFGQWITGPAVNAVLILAAAYVGLSGGILIGLLTPLFAFLAGVITIPPPIAVFIIPMIMIANMVLVLVFHFARRINNYVGVILAAPAKFLTFYLALHYVLVWLTVKLPEPLVVAFGVTQLFTALIGGLIAALIISRYPLEG